MIRKLYKTKYVWMYSKMRGLKIILGFMFIMLVINMSGFAYALNDLVALQGNVKQAGVVINSGNLTVVIYDNETGGNIIYNSTDDFNNSISNGKYGVMLGNGSNELTLNFSQIYYLDIWVNGENFNFSGNDRQMFQSSVGDLIVNGTGVLLNIKNDSDTYLFVNGTSGYVGVLTAAPSSLFEVGKISGINEVNLSGILYMNSTSGYVGINTASPGAVLEVSSTTANLLNISNTTNPFLFINGSTGYVGIGINNPSSVLDVRGSGNFSGTVFINNATDISTFGSPWQTGSNILYNDSTSLKVGIGISTPGATFEVSSTTANLLNISNLSDNILFVNGSTGYVGIGIANPSSVLDVRGQGNFSGNLYVDNGTLVNTWLYNQTTPAINYANLFNNTKNIQEILNATGVYSIPLTINNTKNIQEILNATGVYTDTDTNVTTACSSDQVLLGNGSCQTSSSYIGAASPWQTGDNILYNDSASLKVGIGTATPGAVLEVSSTTANLLNISNLSDNILFVNGSTGYVGIGTTSPNSILEVSRGNLTIRNETATSLYFKFSQGGYMYDNGTALILGHS